VEPCDVFLEEGYGTCDKDGIDSRDLVVERFFHAFWGVEYKDSWWGLAIMVQDRVSFNLWDSLKQNAVM